MNTKLNPESMLFVGPEGLYRVAMPFHVICIEPVSSLDVGDTCKVYRVIEGSENELLYFISKKYISHHNFHYYQ